MTTTISNWPTFTDGTPIMPGDSMPTLRGDMLEVMAIEIGKTYFRIWGKRNGERYIINEGDTDELEQPRTLEEASGAPFHWFDMDERTDQ
ncbi:MAG: hypothetical protein IJ113_00955 [Eggerthellaceae bacterium]|nr:hypothetical protein [Eggerthellaceae bacterium]